ncbi:SDR family oxidoreductase [Aureimonas fodinaquatilis]|uniref:dTDP-4-dehydrorhamnose reductase n=2 Tax=Aureimonas fodinaquatilis TaxID=2565783 RepID=A0A5B0E5C6_9HYPH|nr:SDR family oxidoreductase [Aureimonas fodinaquatilis]
MLGNSACRLFAASPGWETVGVARKGNPAGHLPGLRVVEGFHVGDTDFLVRLLAKERPDLVLNCVGVIKQLELGNDPTTCLEINSLFPHRLAHLCALAGARLVQVSTDCVFDGTGSLYKETDTATARDVYGLSKFMGEVDYPNAITLRTSIIGHEVGKSVSLIDWFLGQAGPVVNGYTKAIYSGLPTNELARIVRDIVAPRPDMRGLWHVASAPIDKFSLLQLVAATYGKNVTLRADDSVRIDRSLDASRFNSQTGYAPASWPELVADMHRFHNTQLS